MLKRDCSCSPFLVSLSIIAKTFIILQTRIMKQTNFMKKITLLACTLLIAISAWADELPVNHIELTDAERQLVKSNNVFAFNLFRKARGDKNSIMSPLSITYALGMLNNGAAGQTQQEICDVLGFGDAGADGINQFCRKLLSKAPTLDQETTAEIANTIYVNKSTGYELQQGFIDKANEFYDAKPEALEFFDAERTVEIINDWGNEHTHGMIPKVLDISEFDRSVASILLNAIYFKGVWAYQFDKANTREEAFNGGSAVPMMSQMAKFEYTEGDLFQTVCLPYGNGAFEMTVFLPREDKTIDDVLAAVKTWYKDVTEKVYRPIYEVDLKMPRIKTDTDINLVPIMQDLGMTTAFTIAAEFPYFGNRDVYISKMFQKAVIELDEEGTKAAAITVIDMTESVPLPVSFHADRPFFYIITERSTGIIFFIGQYLGESTNGISPVDNGNWTRDNEAGVAFDLSGRQIANRKTSNCKLKRGLYIINGKKVVVN